MPDQNQPDPSQNPVSPPANQSSVPPVFSPGADLPPIPPAFQSIPADNPAPTATDTSATPPADQPADNSSGSAAPPDSPPVISAPKKKFGAGKVIATILGLFLLVGGIAGGVLLTGQQQLFEQKAAGCTGGKHLCSCPAGSGCVGASVSCNAYCGVTPANPPANNNSGGSSSSSGTSCTSGKHLCSCKAGSGCVGASTTCDSYCGGSANVVVSGGSTSGGLPANAPVTGQQPITPGATCTGYRCTCGGNNYCNSNTSITCQQYCGEAPVTGNNTSGGSCGSSACVVGQTACDPGTNTCKPITGNGNCKTNKGNCWVTNGIGVSTDPDTAGKICDKSGHWTTCSPGYQCTGGDCKPVAKTTGGTTPPSTGTVTGQCVNVTAYTEAWSPLSGSQLSALTSGAVVNFCVASSATSGTFDKAQFMIGATLESETTTVRPSSTDFCQSYTIAPTDTSVTVKAKVHHATLGWFGEAI